VFFQKANQSTIHPINNFLQRTKSAQSHQSKLISGHTNIRNSALKTHKKSVPGYPQNAF